MFCNFSQGLIHGYTKTFNSDKELIHTSWYNNGTPYGVSWQHCTGGGHLVGNLDINGNFTGGELAYIYPDHTTALVGTFIRGKEIGFKYTGIKVFL